MKKVLCLICVLVFGITCFTGCGKGSADIEVPKEITVVEKSVGIIDVSNLSLVNTDGVEVTDNIVTIKGGSELKYEYDLYGFSDNVQIVVDAPNCEIVLCVSDSLEMSNAGTVISVLNASKFSINTKADASFKDIKEYLSEDEMKSVIDIASETVISGEYPIKVESMYGRGIYSSENIKIDGVELSVISVDNCIASDKEVSVNCKKLSLTSEMGKGITAEGNLTVDNGTIVIQAGDEGLESKGILAINGGVLDITANDDALNAGTPDALKDEREALNPEPPKMPEGEMPPQWNGENPPPMPEKKPEFNGGKARIGGGGHRKMPELPEGVTPGMAPEKVLTEEDLKFFSEHCIEISGGKISITANGDAIDSNGNLTISGGEIFINGPVGFDNSALDCDGAMNISGAKISCVFSGGMIQKPTEDSVKSLVYKFENGLKFGDKIELKDSGGKVIVEHKVGVEAPVFMYLGNEITDGSTYTISLNGTDAPTQITIDVNADLKRVDKPVKEIVE